MNAFDDPPPPHGAFFVSTDKKLIDQRWLVANLLAQPWAECWTHERMAEAITNSTTFGVYRRFARPDHAPGDPVMVGFARVIGDGCTYSVICDVVIEQPFRGVGLGKFLMATIVAHPCVRKTVSILRTSGAQGLYEKFGYREVKAMRRIPTP